QPPEAVKAEPIGPFRKVSLRVTASADLRELADFLTSLEFGPLRVSIPFIELSRRGAVVRGGQTSRAVAATLEIGGILQGSAANAAQPAAAPAPGAGGGAPAAPASLPPPNIPADNSSARNVDPLGTANLGNQE